MIRNIPDGVYPTMVTPFTDDNKIDYNGVEQLLEWYWKNGVDGIFAICQSSEIFFLSFEERLEMVKQCKYVDRVISVDKNYSDELVVWKELRYSCLFLDKHREENTDFIWLKRKLYSLGVEIESISYTESEAYMKLKELVDNECDIGVTYAEKNK